MHMAHAHLEMHMYVKRKSVSAHAHVSVTALCAHTKGNMWSMCEKKETHASVHLLRPRSTRRMEGRLLVFGEAMKGVRCTKKGLASVLKSALKHLVCIYLVLEDIFGIGRKEVFACP